MDNIYAVASSSSSTTYGSVMVAFKEEIIRKFPPNQFTDVHISSEVAYVNFRRRRGRNTTNEIAKLKKPYMTIQPQIQPPNGDMYLSDIPLTKNIGNVEHNIMTRSLFPLIINKEDGYSLMYKMNRDQLQFDCRIRVETLIQQIDLYKYMQNHIWWDNPHIVKAPIEAMIPREIVSQMNMLSNIHINDTKTNQIPTALVNMNHFACFPITYKMRTGTASDEFFMYYTPELIVTLTDLSPEGGNMRNMISDYYEITFRATVDFNLPGVFILVGEKPKPDTLKISLDVNDHGTHDLIPLYSIHNLTSKYQDDDGYVFLTLARFQTESDPKTKKDTISLDVLFDEKQLNVIRSYVKNELPTEALVHLYITKNNEPLDTGESDIKWSTMTLTINNADDTATYTILIYVNGVLFNEELGIVRDKAMRDKDSL